MAQKIRIKRSAVPGKQPLETDLELGELAINTNDGRLYTKTWDGATQQVVEIGPAGNLGVASFGAKQLEIYDLDNSTPAVFDGVGRQFILRESGSGIGTPIEIDSALSCFISLNGIIQKPRTTSINQINESYDGFKIGPLVGNTGTVIEFSEPPPVGSEFFGIYSGLGAQGIQGRQGATGAGTQGADGAQGADGLPGADGSDGSPGAQGADGLSVQGSTGLQGADGLSVQGTAGESIQGIQGVQGPTGSGSSLTIQELAGAGGTLNVNANNINTIQFDNNSGFNVTDNGDGSVFVDLGSTFNPWYIEGSNTLQADGEEPIQFLAGPGISFTSDNTSTIKSLTISSTLESGSQGIQGIQGFQGVQGIQGSGGLDGADGQNGSQGIQGYKGETPFDTYLVKDTIESTTIGGISFKTSTNTTPANFQQISKIFVHQDAYVNGTSLSAAYPENGVVIIVNRSKNDIIRLLYSGVNAVTSGNPLKTIYELGQTSSSVTFLGGDARTNTVYDWAIDDEIEFHVTPAVAGPQGIQGTTGNQGIQGIQGHQGIQGLRGTQGQTGVQGGIGPSAVTPYQYNLTTNDKANLSSQEADVATPLYWSQATEITFHRTDINGLNYNTDSTAAWEYCQSAIANGSRITLYAINTNIDTGAFINYVRFNAYANGTNVLDGQDTVGYSFLVDYLDGSQGVPATSTGTVWKWGFTLEAIQGVQGLHGEFAAIGLQGVQGPGGAGPQGVAGISASYLSYKYAKSSDPTADGYTRFLTQSNSLVTDLNNIAKIDIHTLDQAGVVPYSWPLGTVATFTNITRDQRFTAILGPSTSITWNSYSAYRTDDVQVVSVYNISNGDISAWTLDDEIAVFHTPAGPQGIQGIQGNLGIQGRQGTTGPEGPPGQDGSDGLNGAQGAVGASVQGTQGIQGLQGLPGEYAGIGLQGLQGIAGSGGSGGGVSESLTIAYAIALS